MDEPARKRRRTASLVGDEQRASSPLKKPPRRRPSFASPTKASIARFNPNLLPPRPTSPESTTTPKQTRADVINRGKQARAFIFGDHPSDGLEEYIARHEHEGLEEEDGTAGTQLQQQENRFRDLNSSPRRRIPTVPLPDVEEEEPELPTTSSPGVMQPDTLRRGALFSSPSKRPPRMKDPFQPERQKHKQPERQKRTSPSATSGGEGEEHAEQGPPQKKRERPDPEIEAKKREKEALLRELEELESDVAQCTDTIHKLHDPNAPQILSPADRDDLISIINKLSSPDDGPIPEEDQPPPISNLLCSFLPFTAHTIAPPLTQDAQGNETIPSHAPLELSDPLPYLSLFTSLTFTSTLSLPSTKTNQTHTITATSPQKLLVATLTATIDTLTHRIIDLEILRLSHWAERELGTYIRAKAVKDRDIGSVSWAINSYYELSRKRSEHWYKCEKAFGHLINGRRVGEDGGNVAPFRKAGADGKSETGTGSRRSMSRKDILRHLGRDTLVLQDRHVLLKLCWRVGFDWTGEAESRVWVEVGVPGVWSEADSTSSLKKIPQTFDKLVEARGVFEGTRILVGLLFSGEE